MEPPIAVDPGPHKLPVTAVTTVHEPTTTTTTTTVVTGSPDPPVAKTPAGPLPPQETTQTTVTILRPERPPPSIPTLPSGKPGYTGPKSGTLVVSARVDKGAPVVLSDEGVPGGLPGVPVIVDFDSREFAVVTAPSPANGWKKLVLRSRNKVHSVISVRWTVLE